MLSTVRRGGLHIAVRVVYPVSMSEQQHGEKATQSSRPRIRPADAVDGRPVSVSARLGRLQFHESGKFRVLQFADIQDGPKVSSDTIRLIEASLDATRPDVVIFTGNQVAGYDTAYADTFRKRRWSGGFAAVKSADRRAAERRAADLERTREKVRGMIGRFTAPLAERGIPWAVTYGNHDFQCGLDNAELDAIYREFPGCLNPESTAASADHPRTMPGSGLPDQLVYPCEPGTFALPVSDVDHTHTVLGLVLLDSGDYARSGGYGAPSGKGFSFLRRVPELLGEQSMLFQHMAMPQYYDLLREVPANAANAIQGYRAFDGHSYVLDETKTEPGSYLGEGISCPDHDYGEFALLKETRGYFAVAVGHDHRNGFVGAHNGIMLVATPTCGFGSYGPVPEKRAARLFEFDIRHPHEPRTQLLEFGDLVGKPNSKKAYAYGMTSVKPDAEGMDLLHKPGLWSWLAGIVRRRKAR